MSVEVITPTPVPVPNEYKVEFTLTEDEFLLLTTMVGQTHGILSGQYWELANVARELDPSFSRRQTLYNKHVG